MGVNIASEPFLNNPTLPGVALGVPAPQAADLSPVLFQYQALSAAIAQGQASQVQERSRQADAALQAANARLQECQKLVAGLQATSVKDEVKAQKADHPNFFKKALCPGKVLQRQEVMHLRLEQDTAALAAANANLAAAASTQAAAAAAAAAARVRYDAWQASRQQETQLLDRTFAGPCPLADAAEAQFRAQYAASAAQEGQLKQYQMQYASAAGQLQTALAELVASERHFMRALRMADMDVMFGGPSLFGPDMMDMYVVQQETLQAQQGAALYAAAAGRLISAKALCPDVPRIDLMVIQGITDAFTHMVFDNIILDLVIRDQILRNLQTISVVRANVQYAVQWMDSTLMTRISGDLARMQAQTLQAHTQMEQHRRHLLNVALAAQQAGRGAGTSNNTCATAGVMQQAQLQPQPQLQLQPQVQPSPVFLQATVQQSMPANIQPVKQPLPDLL